MLQKDFVDATEDDIRTVVGKLNTMRFQVLRKEGNETTVFERQLSDWTKQGYKIALKKFYRWLRKKRRGQNPVETDWIEGKKIRTKINASDLLSPEDVLLMLRTKRGRHPRNRAFILLVFETGGRPIEVLNLRIKDVYFDRYGAKVMLCGKNIRGERTPRAIRIIYATQALANWISMHPGRENPDAPMFVSLSSSDPLEALTYDRARLLLRLIQHTRGTSTVISEPF